MTPDNFCYWLQGVFEGQSGLTNTQKLNMIEEHLKLVFTKVTPDVEEDVEEDVEDVAEDPYAKICEEKSAKEMSESIKALIETGSALDPKYLLDKLGIPKKMFNFEDKPGYKKPKCSRSRGFDPMTTKYC